VSLTHVSLSAY